MGLLAGIDTFAGWTLLQKNGAAIENAYAASGSDNNDISYFKSIASTLTTPDALLNNYRALSFVTTAFGLGSQVNQTAIFRQLMTQDPNQSGSLAQQLADNRYRNFAGALSNWSPPPFSNPTTVAQIVAGYQQNSFETELGQDNSTLQEAVYFQRMAVGATTVTQLMSDPALLQVVTTAQGIPWTAFGNLSYDQQKSILQSKVDMSQFATSDGVNAYIQKFLAMSQLNNATNGTSSPNPLLSLFGSSGQTSTDFTQALVTAGSLNLSV